MSKPIRKAFLVFIDLDPIPGVMHTEKSANTSIRNRLTDLKQYNPEIVSAPAELQPDPPNMRYL